MYAAGNGVHVQMPGSELDQQRQQGGDHRLQNAAGGGGHAPDFATNTRDTLLVVPTLISGLSYQLGTNIPGGYWQDDAAGHAAGDPIMRDKYGRRYWLFMAGSWVAFGASTLLTVGLLTGVPPKSRLVRGAFWWPTLASCSRSWRRSSAPRWPWTSPSGSASWPRSPSPPKTCASTSSPAGRGQPVVRTQKCQLLAS
jgi:hypothetical protein